jgi:uncharacterized protein YndB with AHSA1/START domain
VGSVTLPRQPLKAGARAEGPLDRADFRLHGSFLRRAQPYRYGQRMSEYAFVTTWCLDAPIGRVFDAIDDAARWPQWWKGVRAAELLEEGGEGGVGRLWRLVWRSRLPYDLEFQSRVTRREPPYLLEGSADGELIGIGRWRLFEGRGTAVVYEWNVRTAKEWMNRLAPIARPAFEWNHNVVMRQGGQGLARRLGAELLVCD